MGFSSRYGPSCERRILPNEESEFADEQWRVIADRLLVAALVATNPIVAIALAPVLRVLGGPRTLEVLAR